MYKCMVTGKLSREGEKLNKITIETREKIYTHWDREAEENWESRGIEIVRELNASQAGLDRWNSWNAEEKAAFVAGFPSTGG
jgi:hypothetical protein